MSKWAICSKSERFTHLLISSERPERIAHRRSFVLRDLSDSLMVVHFLWATWAIRSRLLICLEQSEQIAHSRSFDLSKMSKWEMSEWAMSEWAMSEWVNSQPWFWATYQYQILNKFFCRCRLPLYEPRMSKKIGVLWTKKSTFRSSKTQCWLKIYPRRLFWRSRQHLFEW